MVSKLISIEKPKVPIMGTHLTENGFTLIIQLHRNSFFLTEVCTSKYDFILCFLCL